jgi:hypothetical protein
MRTVAPLYTTMTIAITTKLLLGSCLIILLQLPCQGWMVIPTPQASFSKYTQSATKSTASSPTIGIAVGISIGNAINRDRMRLDASSSPLPEDRNDDEGASVDTDQSRSVYRAAFSGVAVSPTGFWVMLQVAPDQYWPVQVTAVPNNTNANDRPAAAATVTSPEALTLLQLLAGVDMAGAILPPDILARIILGVCDTNDDDRKEENNDNADSNDRMIRDLVRRSSNWPDQTQVPAETTFLELSDWWQSRIRLPICTLDEIQYQETASGGDGTWEYQCQVQDVGPHTVTPTCHVLQKVAWSDPDTATATDDEDGDEEDSKDIPCREQAAFFALALALRYKAPIRISLAASSTTADPASAASSNSNSLLLSHAQVLARFPLYRSRDKLQETSATVTTNIERGFEYHNLQRALQIAIQKNDMAAAAKIRVRLDEMDSLQDLPVQPETDTQNMQ